MATPPLPSRWSPLDLIASPSAGQFVAVHSGGTSFETRALVSGDLPSHSLTGAHTVSGLTAGHLLKATGATSFGFAALAAGDPVSGGGANRVLYQDGSSLLATSANFTFTAATGQLALPTTGSGAGLLVGGDAQLYRSAADTLRTPDNLVVDAQTTLTGIVGVGTAPSAGQALRVRGTSNSTSTYATLWQNSDATQLGSLRDDGFLALGGIGATSPASTFGRITVIETVTRADGDYYAFGWQGAGNVTASLGWTIASNAQTAALLRTFNNLPLSINISGTVRATLGTAGQLALPTTGSGAGILLGGDAQLYRSAADVLRTPDSVQVDGTMGLGSAPSTTTKLLLPAGTTGVSPLRFTSGVAPTSPVDGDVWFDGTDLKIRVSGATYTITKA